MTTKKSPTRKKPGPSNLDSLLYPRIYALARTGAAMTSESSPQIATVAGSEQKKMSIKVEYKGGANHALLYLYVFDSTNNRLVGRPQLVTLSPSGSSTFLASVGVVYVLDCKFDGLPGASIQITVSYPPSGIGVSPEDAGQIKHEDTQIKNPKIGFNEVYLFVPSKGAIK